MHTLYITVMMLHFMVDFLLLLGTGGLTGRKPSYYRCGAACLLGSLYALFCLIGPFPFLGNWKWPVSLIQGCIVYGLSWKPVFLFSFLQMGVGGLALTLDGGNTWRLILALSGLLLIAAVSLETSPGKSRILPVTVTYGGKTVHLSALEDTGNTLKDPITGASVLVADARAGFDLLQLSVRQLESPLETMTQSQTPGLRLIPYRAIGKPAGMLLAVKPDRVTVAGKQEQLMVAFAPQQIGAGAAFNALAGGSL